MRGNIEVQETPTSTPIILLGLSFLTLSVAYLNHISVKFLECCRDGVWKWGSEGGIAYEVLK